MLADNHEGKIGGDMTKKIVCGVGVFALVFLPTLALSFLAYTVFHQNILLASVLIAIWAAFFLSKLTAEQERLNREVFLQAYELKKAKEALDSCLATETETPVYNRRLLDSKLTEECNRSRRYGRSLSCLLIAIDSLSELSQTYDSFFSGVVVQEVARFLKESIRSVDSLIRYGNERLVVILPETSLTQAGVVANRMRFAVEKKTFSINQQSLKLTLSAGVVSFDPAMHRGKEEIINILEEALLRANKTGPNQVSGITGQSI